MFSNSNPAPGGELPDLLTHLEDVYRAKMHTEPGSKPDLNGFLRWARAYLFENRPAEVFAVDNNYGVLFTHGQRVKLCPSTSNGASTGDMANPESSISITRTK